MQIVKFRVWNYKSIIDLGDCYPTGNVTALAGKNESGKTSILEALQDFNVESKISEEAIPINAEEDEKPKISITFRVDGEELKRYYKKLSLQAIGDFPSSIELTLTKDYPDEYSLDDAAYEKLPKVSLNKFDTGRGRTEALAALSAFKTALADDATFTQLEPILTLAGAQRALENINDAMQGKVVLLASAFHIKPENSFADDVRKKLDVLVDRNIALYFGSKFISAKDTKFLDELLNGVPHFILFNSFEDVFPNTIPLEELDKNGWITDLKVISEINVETIKGKNRRTKKKHKEDLNIKLNKDYEKFWHQDLSKLAIEWDNEQLEFWIVEDGEFYEPKQRSQGRMWVQL